MNTILCEYVNKNKYNAGNKARNDVIRIANELGYIHVPLFRSGAPKLRVVFQLVTGSVLAIFHTGYREQILIQYPYYPPIVNKLIFKILNLGKRLKGYKMILLIHDVLGLRNDKLSADERLNTLNVEIGQMMSFDKIICHNDKMVELFSSLIPSDKYRILGPFDYLFAGVPIKCEMESPWKIIIAGNLEKEKCGYLYHLPRIDNVIFQLYGNGYSGSSNDSIKYHGSYPPDELIDHLIGHFGLVWDGDSCDTCAGIYGEYLRYNNPHKFSLYIAAGIPLIVWKQSALADCVRENKLGICIGSLKDLNVLNELTKINYVEMLNSVMKYREDIIRGNHLKEALSED